MDLRIGERLPPHRGTTELDDLRDDVGIKEGRIHGLPHGAREVGSLADGLVEAVDILIAQSFVEVPPGRNLPRLGRRRFLRGIEIDAHDADDDLLMVGQMCADQMLDRLPVGSVDLGRVANDFFPCPERRT